MNLRVSVIVPVHDGARFVEETIASVRAQTLPAHELVVVDDGSTDRTPELLARLDPCVRVLRQENQGVAAARNHGARVASGDVLAFLDQDDLWEPDLLATLVPALEQRPEWSLVHADSWVIDARGNAHGRRGRFLGSRGGARFEALLARNSVPLESMLVRRAAFERAGSFEPAFRYLEDWDLALRLARAGPFGFVDQPLARYRVHARNLSHALAPLLEERFLLLDRVEEHCAPLTDRERRIAECERARTALDLAWNALRRGDLAAARAWRARARTFPGRAPWTLRARVALLARLLELDAAGLDPAGLGGLARELLPRRRLYGLLPDDLEPGERFEP